ncbi:MAG: pitrilysin family protein [Candidatus Eremiobacteraeota bacterium]|nr:pitrilysin family protein [Candidatus Eremiobacteraeota bacterium]
MKRYIAALAFIMITAACGACAEDIRLDVKEFTLKNGMRFIVVPSRVKPAFSAYMFFDAGAIREVPGSTGIAHLLEHMMFKGTKDFGTLDYKAEEPIMKEIDALADQWYREKEKERNAYGRPDKAKMQACQHKMRALLDMQRKYIVSNELQRIYSENGSLNFNAFTDSEVVCYLVALPANRLELWAAIESDRIGGSVLREFYSERDVVNEERRMRENSPSACLWEEFYSMLYSSSPYRNPVIGYESDISTVRRKDAAAFYHSLYAPSNAVVALVGDIDAKNAERLMRKYFEPLPSRAKPDMRVILEKEQRGERRIDIEADASPELIMGFHGPPIGSKDYYVLKVISSLLTQGRSSRLQKSLVMEKKVARSVNSYFNVDRFATALEISSTPLAPHGAQEVEDAVTAELEALKKTSVEGYELEKVLNLMEMGFINSLRQNSRVAYMLGSEIIRSGDFRNFDERSRLRQVTPDDIMAAAGKYFTKKNRTVAVLTREKPGQAEKATPPVKQQSPKETAHESKEKKKAAAVLRSSPGARRVARLQLPPLKMNFPEVGKEIKRIVLGNGLVVYLREDHSLPLIDMDFIFKDGALYETKDKKGIARLTTSMLRGGGTAKRSAESLDEALDRLGASFSAYPDSPERTDVAFSILSRNFDKGYPLFVEAVTEPSFQEDRLDLRKSQVREDERRKNDNPSDAARREFSTILFGDHPYGWFNDPCWPEVQKMTRADVEEWYRARYTPDNAWLYVDGDFNTAGMTETLEETFGAWKPGEGRKMPAQQLELSKSGGIYHLQKNMSQSIILIGHEGVDRYSSDRYALEVMDYILGRGSFGSRLMKKIRSDEGLAYDVSSLLNMDYAQGGAFTCFAQTKAASTRKVIDMMRSEIEAMKNSPPSQGELRWAKESLVNRFAHYLDSHSLGYDMMGLEVRSMPRDYYRTYTAKVNAVTLEEVKKAAGKYLHPDRLAILVVGDREKLGAQLEGLGGVKEIRLQQ